jgi:hypothetical protein
VDDGVARVVLAHEQPDIAEEVMHFLDRGGHGRVVATAADARQLSEAIRQLEPDVLVAQPRLVERRAGQALPWLAIDTAESVSALRAAIGSGANGFYVWPRERAELGRAAATLRPPRGAPRERMGRVIAVYGSRGGVGVTFVGAEHASDVERIAAELRLDREFALTELASPAVTGLTRPGRSRQSRPRRRGRR